MYEFVQIPLFFKKFNNLFVSPDRPVMTAEIDFCLAEKFRWLHQWRYSILGRCGLWYRAVYRDYACDGKQFLHHKIALRSGR